jgi:hypothetical protein
LCTSKASNLCTSNASKAGDGPLEEERPVVAFVNGVYAIAEALRVPGLGVAGQINRPNRSRGIGPHGLTGERVSICTFVRQYLYFCARVFVLLCASICTFVPYGGAQCGAKRRSAEAVCHTAHLPAYVSIRQHTSAYVSIRQHASACVSIRQHTSAYVSMRQHTSA